MKNRSKKSKRLFTFLLSLALTVGTLWGGLSGTWNAGETSAEGEKDYGVAAPRLAYCSENESCRAVTYDIIEFGSYPQSEVTGTELTAAIKNAAYDKNGDAVVNGVKYRRVTKEDATCVADSASDDFFDYYDWNSGGDENGYHYFKYEPIRWRVLSVDGEKALLLSETALDDKKYNDTFDEEKSYTWEGCTLRSWLNGYASAANGDGVDYTGKSFIGSAFTESEEGAIVTTTLTNADNPEYGTEGGNDTRDKVFLLSLSDIRNTDYAFVKNIYTSDEARRVKASTYAWAMGTWTNNSDDYAGDCWWWLRSPGSGTDSAADVYCYGNVSYYGNYVDGNISGCRPALYLDLSSVDMWKKAGVYSTGNGEKLPEIPEGSFAGVSNPKVVGADRENCSFTNITYDVIVFGSYPQSEVTGSAITVAIKNATYDKNGDAEVDGAKYRRVTKADATYVGSGSNSEYYNWNSGGDENGYHYFKYEPIRWRVLKVDGKKALLLSETALDDKKYNDTYEKGKSYTWEDCTLRSWLNGYASAENGDGADFAEKNFIGSAFTEAEEAAIVTTTLINADNPDYGTEGGNDTRDKVFLLSLSDTRNTDHGFAKNMYIKDEARRVKASAYARAMGTYTYNSGTYAGNCRWWLRSPGFYTHYMYYAAYVTLSSTVENYGLNVDYNFSGCCPALYLDLTSTGTWKKAGTYSTGKNAEQPDGPVVEFKRGDVDHDGSLTPDDALWILMNVANKTSAKYHEDTAECDGKKGITPDDALQILMCVANKASAIDQYWREDNK